MVAPGSYSWNATILAVDGDEVTLDARAKWVNFPSIRLGQVSWAPIAIDFQAMGDRWRVDQSLWAVECPLLATGRFVAANQRCWDVLSETTVVGDTPEMQIEHVGARPVEGLLLPGREWQVVYPDAIDDNVDIGISQWHGRGPRQEHLYIFRGMPFGSSEFVEIAAKIRTNGHVPDWQGDPLSIADGASVILPSDSRLGYGIRPAVGWYYDADGAMHVQPIDVVVERKVDHVLLTKRIRRALIAEALAAREGGELRVDQTLTVYPDPDVETTTCDGSVTRTGANVTYSTLTNSATGSSFSDSSTTLTCADLQSSNTSSRYSSMTRGVAGFALSIPGATVSSAKVGVTGTVKSNTFPGMIPGVALVSCSPASNTGLTANDFGTFVKTLKSDTVFNYSSSPVWNGAGVNEFPLNAAAVAALNLSGVNFFGLMDSGDYSGSAPGSWSTTKQFTLAAASAETTGTGSDPYLTITYTGGGGGGGNRRRRLLLAGLR